MTGGVTWAINAPHLWRHSHVDPALLSQLFHPCATLWQENGVAPAFCAGCCGLCHSPLLPRGCGRILGAVTVLPMMDTPWSLVTVQVTERFSQFLRVKIWLRRKERCTVNGPCTGRNWLLNGGSEGYSIRGERRLT